jgi:opacity protein-like surface antigen
MKFIKYSIVATFLATSAIAADLPSKSAPVPPTRIADPMGDTSWYGGLAVGGIYGTKPWYDDVRVTASGGYEFGSLARAEVTYDYKHSNHSNNRAHTFMGNGIAQMKLPFFNVVPYAIAGAGYRFADLKNEGVWNVGAGLRFELSPSIDLDGRYRYISDFKRKQDENVVTLGASYKF